MSAFDDEFGLFGNEDGEEDERRSTLGARKIATGETIINDIEPEDDAAPAQRRNSERPRQQPRAATHFERRPSVARPPVAPEVSQSRATELLMFLTKKLVSKPDVVNVEVYAGERGPVLELAVDPDDLGKVIGRSGRVAQALRTVVRAGAESKIAIDILDVDEVYEDEEEPAVGEDVSEAT